MAVAEKEGAVSRCGAAKMMPRWISRWIAFRFYDPAAEPSLSQIVDYDLADQKPREFQGL
jgi:hypothetical protein